MNFIQDKDYKFYKYKFLDSIKNCNKSFEYRFELFYFLIKETHFFHHYYQQQYVKRFYKYKNIKIS